MHWFNIRNGTYTNFAAAGTVCFVNALCTENDSTGWEVRSFYNVNAIERLQIVKKRLTYEIGEAQGDLNAMKKAWLDDCIVSIAALDNTVGIFGIMLEPKRKRASEDFFSEARRLIRAVREAALDCSDFYGGISLKVLPLAKSLEELVNCAVIV